MMAELKALTEAEGRDYGAIEISFKAPVYDPGTGFRDGERRRFTGSPDAVIDDIKSYEAIGISEMIFDFRGDEMSESLDRMEKFAVEIMVPAEK